jgi:hypothetical protein
LLNRGVVFNNAWSNPLCSPTRAGILTGRYSFRTGVGDVVDGQNPKLNSNENKIPEVLDIYNNNGISKALFGKWHVTTGGPVGYNYPNTMGFDHYEGSLTGALGQPGQLAIGYNNWTKITYDTEEYDTNSNFASSTFTPTVAGYYLFTARNQFIADGVAMAEINSAFFKNGTIAKTGTYKYQPAALTAQFGSNISAVIYCNGTTDYVECYGRTDGSTLYVYGAAGAAPYTYFQGILMRAA